MENFKKQIEQIIDTTFKTIEGIYNYREDVKNLEAGSIIFPKKRDGTFRISEQELRFLFVSILINKIKNKELSYDNKPIYYSVETPTVGSYSFKGDKALSGNIDLVIHGGYPLKRICLIEFKAHNVEFKNDYEKLHRELNHKSDDVDKTNFEKLYDENACGYFVQLLPNSDRGTADNIIQKYEEADEYKCKANKFSHICYSLKQGKYLVGEIKPENTKK